MQIEDCEVRQQESGVSPGIENILDSKYQVARQSKDSNLSSSLSVKEPIRLMSP